MTIEHVEGLPAELQIYPFCQRSPLDEPKMFLLVAKVSIIGFVGWLVAKAVGLAVGDSNVGTRIAKGCRVIPKVLSADSRVEAAMLPGC